ncbi:hypothetical protein NV379_01950 [Paenibacillus sp. N1-5-1-14]|uniref:hypothetical protein n=1 Tax=Paenibacillus radicibacter TaxID=2972488 RepID=UPI002158EA4B|nr:hypothetical protein [Paenibacillus radicibacter]MCR8641408.1 hypothetical protein [Paenibacillus radicibacter]
MNECEVKVNVINQLKLLRQSTFKDKLSFLDEDIQNAQRAKATRVNVTIDYSNKVVSIENDGKILENPQALFSIAESEWDEDIQNSETPFGMGFFSNITVSDYIEVYSGNKHIVFNVENMIQTNQTKIEVVEVKDTYNGFKLILRNFDFTQIGSHMIRERVEVLGKYIHELDIYCDGKLQLKKELTEGDGSVFLSKIENEPSFKGWIALNAGFSQDLKVFYKGRYVTKLEGFYYAKGDLHITDKALNLTAPDRKDIVRDSKYNDFVMIIKKYLEKLANESVIQGNQNDIERHIDAISNYADKNKLKNEMTFLLLKTENECDAKYLTGIALAKRQSGDIKTLNDYEVFIKSQAAKQSESHFEEVLIESDVKVKAPEAKGLVHHSGSSGSVGWTEKHEINEDQLEERKGQHIHFDEEPVFWLGFDEVLEQEAKFKIAQHYGLRVIVSRNKFESSVLEMLGWEQNIVHISELTEKTSIKATLTNTELSIKEKRALMLLDMISRVVGFNRNVFAIGNLMVLKETSVEVLNRTIEKIEEEFIAVRDYSNDKIYIDRIAIDKSKLREDVEENLDLEDYKFILLNLKEIVRELGLMDFDKPIDLYGSIINTLAVA